MKQMATWLIVLVSLLGVGVFAQDEVPADVTITIDNRGASAYITVSVEGADTVAEANSENAAWTLEPGKRYRIVNQASAGHPFQLRGEGDAVLLSQQEGEDGSLETDAEVNFVSDEEGITFTLSPSLAEAVRSYRCAFHASMTGTVSVAE
jgi:plastocyanin